MALSLQASGACGALGLLSLAFVLESFVWTSVHAQSDEWSTAFARPGVDIYVDAVETFGAATVIGGGFYQAGAGRAGSLAIWDGTEWSELGGGVHKTPSGSYVYDLLARDGDLYVAGDFTVAGQTACANIARWNGVGFSPLGTGTDRAVLSLTDYGSGIVAVGRFLAAGTVNAKRVAYWNGLTWEALGGGFPGASGVEARCALEFGGDLWVGGSFSIAGTTPADNIARWTGAAWDSVGSGLPFVSDLAEFQGSVYAATGKLYRWTGADWVEVALPIAGSARSLRAVGAHLYVAGSFLGAEGGVLRWDGAAWEIVSGELDGSVREIDARGADILIGGEFTRVGNHAVFGVAQQSEGQWRGLGDGQGLNGGAWAISEYANRPVAGGNFTLVQDLVTGPVAAWTGAEWEPIGPLDAPGVNTVMGVGSELFAGLRELEGEPGSTVKRWDGVTWQSIGQELVPGFEGAFLDVYALTQFQSELVCGGAFLIEDGSASRNVARYDGSTWHGFGAGPGIVGSTVTCLTVFEGQLIAGGQLYQSAHSQYGALKWNGTSWVPLAGAISGPVSAMAEWNGMLYLGGTFLSAGGQAANNIVAWDGVAFHPLGSGTVGRVSSLAVHEGTLYVGGWFANAGGVEVAGLARWDGATWSDVESRLETGWGGLPEVRALLSLDGALWAGGGFSLAGGQSSYGVGRFGLPTATVGTASSSSDRLTLRVVGGAPSDAYTLALRSDALRPMGVSVFDVTGRTVRSLLRGDVPSGTTNLHWDGRDDGGRRLPSGVYVVAADGGGVGARRSVLLLR